MFYCVLVFVVMFAPVMSLSAEVNSPHFILEGTFALSKDKVSKDNKHKVVAYLPKGALVFLKKSNNANQSNTKRIPRAGGDEYLLVETNSDIEIYVLKRLISKKSIPLSASNEWIILNSDIEICRDSECREERKFYGRSGDVFQIIKKLGGYILRRKWLEEDIEGYLSKEKFRSHIKSLLINKYDLVNPKKYMVSKYTSELLNAKCSKIFQNNKRFNRLNKKDVEIVDRFELGTVKVDNGLRQLLLNEGYGNEGGAISWNIYEFKETSSSRKHRYIAKVEYSCAGKVKTRIDKVTLLKIVDDAIDDRIWLEDSSTPSDLVTRNKNNDAYLYSVNSFEQYSGLLKKLESEFQDRYIAEYFLIEFNRSCKSRYRRDGLCRSYVYR